MGRGYTLINADKKNQTMVLRKRKAHETLEQKAAAFDSDLCSSAFIRVPFFFSALSASPR